MPAAVVHASIAALTQAGTATERTRFPFPGDVDQHPAVLPLGDRADLHFGNQLRPAQPTTEQESQDGIVAFALEALPVRAAKAVPAPAPG